MNDLKNFSISNKEAKESESSSSNNNNLHHHRPSPSYYEYDHHGGPTYYNYNSSICRPKTSSSSGGVCAAAAGAVVAQPFDISAFKSPGMAGMGLFPFTNAQWKELERQAMIYKYMVASVPVPPDLLFPFLRNNHPLVGNGGYIRFSNGDPEPGRCRRTDGKKWRCSRDAAPDQKYCERHLHRGRPRSRKPVELNTTNNKKKTRLEPNTNNNLSSSQFLDTITTQTQEQEKRSPPQEWYNLMQQQQYQHQSQSVNSLNCYTDFNGGGFNSDFVSLDKQQQTPRGFIDAWSNVDDNSNNNKKSSVSSSSNGNLLLSPLSLSMGGNNYTTIDDEMGRVQMGLGVMESGQDYECNSTKPLLSGWLNPVSYTPGGPLAEVLRLSTVTGGSDPPSPITSGNSPPATTVSSPSGVLQKLATWSDSSGNSSPTSRANNNKHEVALMWLNQGKFSSST